MYSFPKRKPIKGKPVTLIVGIICKDGIILSADSQTTKGDAKLLGTNKISVVEFENEKALVAESGSQSLSTAAIAIFQRKAKEVTVTYEAQIAKIAEDAVREVVRGITAHLNPNSPDRERQEFLFEQVNYFELMIAYYFGDKPCLYKLNPAWCIPVPATSYFMTSGIAGDLANFLLKEHTSPEMDSQFASVIAIKVVQDAIDNVEGCGAPIRMASLLRVPGYVGVALAMYSGQAAPVPGSDTTEVKVFSMEEVEQFAEIILRVEDQTAKTRNKKIHKELRAQTAKLYRSLLMTIDDFKPPKGKMQKSKKSNLPLLPGVS
jgi:20S proteasome alpha/beta subunit